MNNIDRILIETMVRKAMKDIKDSPERSTRNLIDLGLDFANGRFQQKFLKTAQKMFEDGNGAYYHIVQDTVANVNSEKLITFGMNVGYNSCTYGAKKIREIEQKENFDIPWTVSVEISKHNDKNIYNSIVEQGEKIGIYTWQFFVSETTEDILNLISDHKNCAFVLFCESKDITESLVDKALEINNLMFAVRYDDDATAACSLLRQNGFLYSVYLPYTEKDVEFITSGEVFSSTETLHPVFTMLLPEVSCTKSVINKIYDYIAEAREKQLYQTIPWDAVCDSCYIDRIISEDACFVWFNKAGQFSSFNGTKAEDKYNVFKRKLPDIFKLTFPKQDLS